MAQSENLGPDETFRVRVSLERFFSDERARCYVGVRGARRVRWLARRLRRLFPLPRRLALLSRGHLLPPDEPLALLSPDDPVEVIESTMEIDQTDDDKHLISTDTVDASTELTEPSPDRHKKKKNRHLYNDNSNLPVTIDDAIMTLPIASYNNDLTDNNGSSQEVELIAKGSHHKSISLCESNLKMDVATDTNVAISPLTDNIKEQERTELELSDIERIRVMKEQALMVLGELAARPRRRVRVRRRRKRPTEPCPEILNNISDPMSEQSHNTADFTLDGPHNAADITSGSETVPATSSQSIDDIPLREDDSNSEDIPVAMKSVSTTSWESTKPPDTDQRPAAPVPLPAPEWPAVPAPMPTLSRPAVPAVLRNASAGPRAARLVSCTR